MKNTLQKIILISTSFALSACSVNPAKQASIKPQVTAMPVPVIQQAIENHVPTTPPIITEQEIQQLSDKIKQAEFTLMAFNDQKFIKNALTSKRGKPNKPITEKDVICVYNNINRQQYASEIPEVAQYLAKNYPQFINQYIGKLDQLIPIVKKIYSHPKPVNFNPNDLTHSSALAILEPNQMTELTNIIMNEDYAPLLATIGLPAKKADGTIEDISVMQITSLIEYIDEAWLKCQK